jgi:hypothetical protein
MTIIYMKAQNLLPFNLSEPLRKRRLVRDAPFPAKPFYQTNPVPKTDSYGPQPKNTPPAEIPAHGRNRIIGTCRMVAKPGQATQGFHCPIKHLRAIEGAATIGDWRALV